MEESMKNDKKSPSAGLEQIDLGFGELFAKSGDHIGHFYPSRESQMELLIPYFRKGLMTGDKCFLMCTKVSQRDVSEALETAGVDVEDALSSGQLVFSEGHSSPEEMQEMLNKSLSEIPGKFRFLRASGDATWSFEKMHTTETLMKFESALNILKDPPAIFFCQYDLSKFLGSVVIDVLKTHPLSIIGSAIHQNPFYQDPKVFLEELQSGMAA